MAAGDRFGGHLVLSGEEVGVNVALNVRCNFKPSYLQIINVTTDSIFIWTPMHGAAAATSVIDTGAGATDIAALATNGVTVSDGGFELGTSIQTTSDVVYWTAWR